MKLSHLAAFSLLGSATVFVFGGCNLPASHLEFHEDARLTQSGLEALNRVQGEGTSAKTVTVTRVPIVLSNGDMLVAAVEDNWYQRLSADCSAVLQSISEHPSQEVRFDIALVGRRSANRFPSVVGIQLQNSDIPGGNLCNIPNSFFEDLSTQREIGE